METNASYPEGEPHRRFGRVSNLGAGHDAITMYLQQQVSKVMVKKRETLLKVFIIERNRITRAENMLAYLDKVNRRQFQSSQGRLGICRRAEGSDRRGTVRAEALFQKISSRKFEWQRKPFPNPFSIAEPNVSRRSGKASSRRRLRHSKPWGEFWR